MAAEAVPHGRALKRLRPSPTYTFSGLQPAWAVMAIPFRLPQQRNPALKMSCWERFRACRRYTCTIRCSRTKSATIS